MSPRTLAGDAEAFRRAASDLFWTIADALQLPRFVGWLSRRVTK